jgi:hypothetical protein
MTDIIHLAAEPEPGPLHGLAADAQVYSVHLSFQSLDVTEEDGQAAMKSFLTTVPTGRCYLVALPAAPDNGDVVSEATRLTPDPDSDGSPMLNWLREAKEGLSKLAALNTQTPEALRAAKMQFFARPSGAPVDAATMQSASAFDLMRATAKWPAPLAQREGVMSAVTLDETVTETDNFALVFVADGETLTAVELLPTEPDDDPEVYRITVTVERGTIQSTRAQTANRLVPYAVDEMNAHQLSPDGAYILDGHSDALGRLMVRIEEQSPTLIWPTPSVLGLGQNETLIKTLAGLPADGVPPPDKTELPEQALHWLKDAAIFSVFDVMIGGLLLPADNPTPPPDIADPTPRFERQSTVLQRLSRRLGGYFENQIDPDTGQPLRVDEPVLYDKLHQALWRTLMRVNHESIPGQLEPLLSQEANALIKQHFAKAQPGADARITWGEWKKDHQKFTESMSDVTLVLEGEEGGESWLLDRFAEAFLDENLFVETLFEGTGVPVPDGSNADAHAAFRKTVKDIYDAFTADISGPFDAAEAMRRDFGADILSAALTLEQRDLQTDEDPELPFKEALLAQDVFLQRFKASQSGDLLAKFAPLWPTPTSIGANPDLLHDALTNLSDRRMRELIDAGTAAAVFRPDPSPQPLRLPLMQNLAPEEADFIARHTSGLGFLVRGSFDPDSESVADHVNLIQVQGEAAAYVTVEPTLPMPLPGAASLYMPYDGQPVASPNRAEPAAGGAQPSTAEKDAVEKITGYTRGEADTNDAPSGPGQTSIRTPELSYGAYYDVLGFWVPPSGVLPEGLHPDGARYQPQNPTAGGPFTTFTRPGQRYQRRTAIAETTLTGVDGPRPLAAGVHPLALDDPRLVVERFAGGQRHIDLYRNQDGTGALDHALDANGDAVSKQYELWLVAENGDKPDPSETHEQLLLMGVDMGGLTLEHLNLSVMHASGGTPIPVTRTDNKFEFEVGPNQNAWLGLSCTKPAAGDPMTGTIAFDDPGQDKGQDNAARTTPVLVLAPDARNWTEDQRRTVTLRLPGVSFADFERWASNQALWEAATGLADKKAKNALNWLRTAHAVFEALPGQENRAYADKLNALPDPAVSGYLIGAGIVDGVNRGSIPADNRSHARFIAAAPYAGLQWEDFPATDDQIPASEDQAAWNEAIKKAKATINALFAKAQMALTLLGGERQISATTITTDFAWFGPDDAPELLIPKGQIAQLWATPAVRKSLFQQTSVNDAEKRTTGIFDPRMTTLSCGMYTASDGTDYTLFDGAKLTIEVMHELPDATFAADPIAAHAVGSERGYRVLTDLTPNQRIFSELELITQRWRPSGQPIYTYIDPAPKDKFTTGPVVLVDGTPKTSDMPCNPIADRQITDFEDQAFIGRQPSDGERTRVRLNPAPDETELWQFSWPEHSATYLRHAAILHSRYDAAWTKGAQTRTSGGSDDTFVLRVAVLADVTGPELTRPQLRAHLPLQRSIDADAIAPPVACVLNEPPHAQLGLADRISAEIVTTNVFKIAGPDGNERLQLDTLRKEIGPDPRLSYFPIENDTSMACRIVPEGPVGLHFDAPQTATPAFANSQYLLHVKAVGTPGGADAAEIEESFVGLTLTRHADPGWTWQRALADPNVLTGQSDIWLEPSRSFAITDATGSVLAVKQGQLKAARTALYEDGGTDMVTLAPLESITALLIKPIDEARLRVSLFGQPEVHDGASNRPAMLGSIVIRLSGAPSVKGAKSASALRQSPATFAKWVRTGRDMRQLVDADGAAQPVNDIAVQVANGRITLGTGRVTSPVTQRRYPLHVHRRLVHLLRRPAPQIGAPVALFDQALLSDGMGSAQLSNQAAKAADRADSVVLAELETRADILRVLRGDGEVGTDLAQYDHAAIDLVGPRLPAKNEDRHLRLHFRAANTGFAAEKLQLSATFQYGEGDETTEQSFEIDLSGQTTGTVSSVDVVIYTVGRTHFARVRHPGGAFGAAQELPLSTSPLPLEDSHTLKLSLNDGGIGETETWADVSALQSCKRFDVDAPDAFDFDWIFSGAPAALPEALEPATLNHLPEAQARIVGLTDPLTLQN